MVFLNTINKQWNMYGYRIIYYSRYCECLLYLPRFNSTCMCYRCTCEYVNIWILLCLWICVSHLWVCALVYDVYEYMYRTWLHGCMCLYMYVVCVYVYVYACHESCLFSWLPDCMCVGIGGSGCMLMWDHVGCVLEYMFVHVYVLGCRNNSYA